MKMRFTSPLKKKGKKKKGDVCVKGDNFELGQCLLLAVNVYLPSTESTC